MKRIGKNLSVYTGNNLDTKEFIQMWGYLFLYNEIYTDRKISFGVKWGSLNVTNVSTLNKLNSWLVG